MMYSSESISCNNQYQMMNTSGSNLIDLNDSSNSQGHGDSMFSNNLKKKTIRDPFAHRRVEKTRRDRMNFSLNRLCSLIPESFRNQVNQGNTRVDKIKIVDIAILYVEHLHSMINQQNKDEESKNSKIEKIEKKEAQTQTCDLSIISSVNDIELSYIKGFFNGTLEYLSYLIEFNVLNQINKPNQAVAVNGQSDDVNVIFNIELYINILRKFHAIYFNKIKLSQDTIKSIIQSNIKSTEFEDKSKRSLSFPFNNKKLIKKILKILSSSSSGESAKQNNFFKYYKKIYEYVLEYNISSDKFPSNASVENPCTSSSSSSTCSPVSKSSHSSRSSSMSSDSNDSDLTDQSDDEIIRKKSKKKHNVTSIKVDTLKIAQPICDNKPQSSQKLTAKKLKTNLMERFSSSNGIENEVLDNPAQQIQIPAEDEKKNQTEIEPGEDEMISIFILHSSHDFYLSGSLDKNLLDQSLLKNVIKNNDFRPKSIQKIKLDVVFGADIVIKSSRNAQVVSDFGPLFTNKRKKEHLFRHNRFTNNLSEENRILDSYLKAIRRAHENKKQHLNGSKYDNLTILYKNYSLSSNLDSFSSSNDDDKLSERTFYTV